MIIKQCVCNNRLFDNNCPKFKTITFGYNTIMYQGSKIWKNLSNNLQRESLCVLSAVHFGMYIMSLYISSFLFIHNHIAQKLFLPVFQLF